MKTLLILVVFLLTAPAALDAAEPPITLWPQGTPGALGATAKDIPTLTPYLPAKANGSAMVLIPGGSYSGIFERQGEPFARWLNEHGITVFVLRYRLGSAGYRYPAQLQDAVQAQNNLMSKITAGLPSGGAWSGLSPTVGTPPSLGAIGTLPVASGPAGTSTAASLIASGGTP